MPALYRRDWGDGWGGTGSARWAFFAIFIVIIILVVLGTIRLNRKRSQQGLQPVYGTRWMTPPLYLQLQRSENRRRRDPDGNAYVPAYTEEVNENDMGYYDRNGVFISTKGDDFVANSRNNSTVAGPGFTGLNLGVRVDEPEEAHRRLTVNTDGIPLQEFQPPSEAPPPDILEESYRAPRTGGDEFYNRDEFFRPSGPPPRTATQTALGEGLSTTLLPSDTDNSLQILSEKENKKTKA